MSVTFPPLANNDILLYTVFGTLNDQRILTTFHYKVVGSAGDEGYDLTLSRFLAYQFGADGVLTNMLPLLPTNYVADYHQVQPVYPTRRRYVAGLTTADGTGAGPTNAQNIALSIKRVAVTPTRQGVGRVQLPIADLSVALGYVDLPGMTAGLADFEEACLAEFTPTDSPVGFLPVLFGKDANGTYRDSPIYLMQAMSTVRTMHRRTVGLGI